MLNGFWTRVQFPSAPPNKNAEKDTIICPGSAFFNFYIVFVLISL